MLVPAAVGLGRVGSASPRRPTHERVVNATVHITVHINMGDSPYGGVAHVVYSEAIRTWNARG